MDVLHPAIVEGLKQEGLTTNEALTAEKRTKKCLECFRRSLSVIFDHKEVPEKTRILEDAREDVIRMVRVGELEFQDGRALLDDIDEYMGKRRHEQMINDPSKPVYPIPFPAPSPLDRPPAA